MTTFRAMVTLAVAQPELPVMVTVAGPSVAVLLAVSVSKLLPVVGSGEKPAVTPLGRPDAARVIAPVNPLTSVMNIVSVALLPRVSVREGAEAINVKAGDGAALTVRAILVLAVSVPPVPVMVTVDVPAGTAQLDVNVRTLVPLAGLGLKDAVTPLGNPDAARVTDPENGLPSVIVIVSVVEPPEIRVTDAAEGFKVKLPFDTPQVVPLTANDAGTALVVPFQVPLNPMPERLPPAAILPL